MWIDVAAASVVPGLILGLILNIFYVAVKHVWPANYFELNATADPIISRNLPRYVLFRFLPPAIAVLAATVTAERNDGSPWLATACVLLVHCQRVIRAIKSSLQDRLYTFALAQMIVLFVIVAAGCLATFCRNWAAPLIPEPVDLLGDIWAGVLAAIGAIYLQQVVLVKRDPLTVAKASARDISPCLLAYIHEQAKTADVDESLVYAIMIAEDIQRPKWFRWIEYHFPGRKSTRTMGIMQQPGAKSDKESVDIALANYFVPVVAEVNQSKDAKQDILARVLERYTQNQEFRKLTLGIYESFETEPRWLSDIKKRSMSVATHAGGSNHA